MTRPIRQSVTLNASPDALYETFLVNVPAHDHKGVSQGWRTYYWKPWNAYLAKGK